MSRKSVLCGFTVALLLIAGGWVQAEDHRDLNLSETPNWEGFLNDQVPIYWNHLSAEFRATLPQPQVVETTQFNGFGPFNDATQNYAPQVKLGPQGQLLNYIAGAPFPGEIDPNDPQAALKIMWNYDKRYFGDDIVQEFEIHHINRDGEVVRSVSGIRKRIWFTGRVTLAPIPAFPEWVEKRCRYADQGELMSPQDEEGKIRLGVRKLFDDQLPPITGAVDDQWVYLPSIRRVRRLSGAQREDPLFGSTIITDEVGGGNDRETLTQDFRLLGETEVWVQCIKDWKEQSPIHAKYKLVPLPKRIEKRKVWIIEAKHKNKKYTYGKMLYYIDKEMYVQFFGESYDRRGKLWKRGAIVWTMNDQGIPILDDSFSLDVQSGRGTYFPLKTTPNVGIDPSELSVSRMRRRGR